MGWEPRQVRVGEAEITVHEGGEGPPLLILHDEIGPPEWQAWHAALGRTRRLILPVVPGFAGERLSWMRSVTDLSRFWGRLLAAMHLTPIDAIGLSFGGWVAAEMAINDPGQFHRLALVAPFGLKPSQGHIADMFVMSSGEYIRAGFADHRQTPEFADYYTKPDAAKVEGWEDARIECARLAWQPYMHHPAMEQLLPNFDGLETQIVWGDRDAIVPESAMRAYARAIPKAELTVLEGCGHRPELERTDTFLAVVESFFNADAGDRR